MGRLYSIFGFVLAVAVVVLIFWAVVRGVQEEPGIVGSFATAAAAIIAVVVGRQWEKRLELQQMHRERMAPVYEELFKRFTDPDKHEAENPEFFVDLHRQLLLYAPTSVLREWLKMVRSPLPDEELSPAAMLEWERVLLAIRDDLGHSNRDLKPGDLLRIYIHDVDEPVQKYLAAGGE